MMAESTKTSITVLLSLLLTVSTFQSSLHVIAQQVNNVNPDFVFVHGMAHGAWCFTPLIRLLQEAGYTATAVDLTSHGINKAIADDVVTVAEYVKPLTTLFETGINKSTILVGHSLGGGPISVMAEMFPGKVAKAVYLAAIYPTNQETFFNSMPPSTLKRLVGDGNLYTHGNPPTSAMLNVANLTAFFYNKSPKWGITLASTLVVPTPYRPGNEPITLTSEKFGATRKFYIHTLADFGITRVEQQEMIDASPWAPESAYSLPNADHGAYFSQKLLLSHVLIDIAKR